MEKLDGRQRLIATKVLTPIEKAGLGITSVQSAAVAALCTLPWLNPFSPGPIPAVTPWLVAAMLTATAVVVGALPGLATGPHAPTPWPRRAALAAMLLAVPAWAAWGAGGGVGAAYEALALAGGLWLVLLGALLFRQGAHTQPGGIPWAFWCAVGPWVAAGLVSSVIALVQYGGHAEALRPWINWAPAGEAFANLRQRNQFASLTSIALAALLAWRLRWRSEAGVWRWAGMASGVALLALGNAASSSRTGMLQLLLIAALALLWRARRTAPWVVAALVCYAVGLVLLPWAAGLDPETQGLFARLKAGDAVCASRLTLWSNVLTLIGQAPWRGWGWGELDYAHFMTLYDGPRFCDILDNAHNLPLHLAVELGVPFALLACAALLAWIARARPWREADPLRQLAWTVLAMLGVHSLLEYPLWYGPFQLACGLCLGLLWRAPAAAPGRAAAGPARGATLPVALAALLFAACLYAAWDYRRIGQIYLPPALRAPAYREDTLARIQDSWLFARQVHFAKLSIEDIDAGNAPEMFALSGEMLHFSPEARVAEKRIASARLLGQNGEAQRIAARYAAAFPQAYARWAARQGQ